MSDLVFSCKNGDLWYREWCWGDDDFARNRMEACAIEFETPGRGISSLAQQCRQALADYDAFWLEHIDV